MDCELAVPTPMADAPAIYISRAASAGVHSSHSNDRQICCLGYLADEFEGYWKAAGPRHPTCSICQDWFSSLEVQSAYRLKY